MLHALAWRLQQTFFAALVEVTVQTETESSPGRWSKRRPMPTMASPPDRVVPIQAAPGLIGEIHIWQGDGWLPSPDSRLLQDLAALAATALERARTTELELRATTHPAASDK